MDAGGCTLAEVSRFFQLIHAMVLDIEECISTGAIPNVNMEQGEMYAREVERNLHQKARAATFALFFSSERR